MNAFVRKIGAAVVSLAAVFAAMPSAHAAIVSKSWDPMFNPLLPTDNSLGWMASINFFVPDTCVRVPNGGIVATVTFAGFTLGCGAGFHIDHPGLSVLSAQVGIYDVSSPTALIDVLTFDPATVLSTLSLEAIDTASGDVTKFLSFGTSNAVGGNLARDDCLFRLALNSLTGGWTESPRIEYNCGSEWVTSRDMPDPDNTTFILWPTGTSVDEVLAATELKVVPEPASLALALLALTGVWALRRRG